MATKNNQRTKITKMLLKQSLIEIMNTKTISTITIKEICERAELNRSTFYLHYMSPIELLTDIENEIIENTKNYLQDSYLKSDTFSYTKAFLDYIKSEKNIFKTLLCQKEITSFQDKFINEMLDHLRDSIPYSGPAETKKYVYCYLLKGSTNMIIEWINSDFDISSDMLTQLLLDISTNITN